MPLAWTLAKFLFKVVVPTVPEIVSTVATMKRQQLRDETGEDHAEARFIELEKAVTTQLQVIEQLTVQLQALQKTVTLAFWFAVTGLICSLGILGFLLFR